MSTTHGPRTRHATPDATPGTGLGAPTPGQATAAFALLGTTQATLIFTITIIGVPLPEIGREFGLGPADLVLISAAYGLPFSGLLLFGGRLADRYGGRRMFTAGLAVFGLASAVAAFAPGYEVLVAVRFAQGVGAALTAPAAMAVLRAVYPEPGAYRRAMATWGGLSVLGASAGNLLSGTLTTWVSWRWMFAIPVVVTVFVLALTRRRLPAARPARGRRPGLDPLGAVLATAGITLAGFGLTVVGDHAWTSAAVLIPLGIGVALVVAFLAVERRVSGPLLPPGFVGEPRRVLGLVGILLAAAGTGLISFLVSLYLQQERGWSTLATAGAFVPFTIALIASSRAAGPLIRTYGPSRTTVAGLTIGGAGLLLLAGIDGESAFVTGLLPGMVLMPAGASLIFAGAAVLTTHGVPEHQAGLAGGVMNTAMELGPTVGLAGLMSVAATRSDVVVGYTWALATAGIVFLLAAASAIGAGRFLLRDRTRGPKRGRGRTHDRTPAHPIPRAERP
ncbi:MFS transporter [Streptomyces sp. SID3343]|uniref:MFS transporter n=1 Tax=Streptomyces sp. SID3343 TaxID=2690260 RepID=UPI00136BE486|nr:MFS transporter [Streptomyces sp. SID3343]MYW01422.1 MFS transporter [Streptomyces sp. SID3343]